ncbi:MAG: 3-isopropylmalate dehydrogenase [Spirochaetes bacterium]|nr:3-isopropylmalate dehydrogenase [Spirochaetota bacterium]MBU1080179.1 3-isopropylmalate dehydrogenase [Spirochaetota bacterium]
MRYRIATIPGDGIGPDVVAEARKALEAVASVSGFELEFAEAMMGGAAIDATGEPLPETSLEICRRSDAVLLGAVGGPKWDGLPGDKRPEAGLLGLRAGLGAYANLRPARMFPELAASCPLRADIVAGGLDMLIVRELTGGIYFGQRGQDEGGDAAWDTERYSRAEVERLLAVAYGAARARGRRLCVVDKANVLESSRLWRRVAMETAALHPDVETSFMYVDNCAMQLVRNPRQFDVIATSNMFGDILSDEASMITGSIGMLASASVGGSGPGIFEPIHGSAPDIAGRDAANPLATILSAAMLLSYALNRKEEAALVEGAVAAVLAEGLRCADIASGAPAERVLGTRAMGEAVARKIREAAR